MMENLNTFMSISGEKAISVKTSINAPSQPMHDVLSNLVQCEYDDYFQSIDFVQDFTQEILYEVDSKFHCNVNSDIDSDSYIIKADEHITVYSRNLRGLLYGAYTIAQLTTKGKFPLGLVYNIPICQYRGLKIYLPAPDKFSVFFKIIDMLCYYRFNTVMIEVGGAMEYIHHPEINKAWVKYANFMSEYSGKSDLYQDQTYTWKKNSIHSENGDGKYLLQDDVRKLVEYCNERGLEVIPEIPSLSHSDYLLMSHVELAERIEDPYPDTYCPSNPETYELLFDIIDEVIDVFRPKTINMGHDEYYSIGLCDKCKNRVADDIFADDIKIIHDYLSSKGVLMMIWSEKLLNAIGKKGQTWGGARVIFKDRNGDFCNEIPPTYMAVDKISRDIICMHWYWGIRVGFDQEFISRGFRTVYGNFEAMSLVGLKERLTEGILGGFISNWSHLDELNLQRNSVFMSIAYAAYVFWHNEYAEGDYQQLLNLCFEDLFVYRNREVLAGPHIKIWHTTTLELPYTYYGDGVYMDLVKDLMGEYVIEFADGEVVKYPVVYGVNISGFKRQWTRFVKDEYDEYNTDKRLFEIAGAALPKLVEDKTWYIIAIANPKPKVMISKISFMPKQGLACELLISKMEFFE